MTLYAIRPDVDTGELPEDAEIVESHPYGWRFLRQSETLWALVDPARSQRLGAALTRLGEAAGEGELRMDPPDLLELISLLDGVEETIVAAGIVDEHWRVPPERLEELAKVVPAMDLNTERSLDDKTHALAEVMINAFSIRNFLKAALDAGCVVVLG